MPGVSESIEPAGRRDVYAPPSMRWVIPAFLLLQSLKHSGFEGLLIGGPLALGALLLESFVPMVSIDAKGIRLIRFFELRWEDARDASVHSASWWLGPNLRVRRKQGLPWRVRLAGDGSEEVTDAILRHCPPDNPIHKALTSSRDLVRSSPRSPAVLLQSGVLLGILALFVVAPDWIAQRLPYHSDVARIDLVPSPAPAAVPSANGETTKVTVFGLSIEFPCLVTREPLLKESIAVVPCDDRKSIGLLKPDEASWWLQRFIELTPDGRDLLVERAGSDDPVEMINVWMHLSRRDLRWFTPRDTSHAIRSLLELKGVALETLEVVPANGHRMYDLPPGLRGFEYETASPEERTTGLFLFGPDRAPWELRFYDKSSERPFTQADMIATARSLDAALAETTSR